MPEIKRIHFIEYNARVNTLGTGIVLPKYGTALLASILKERGYDVRIFLEGVSDLDFRQMADCDLACFPVYAPALTKIRVCARQIRSEKPTVPIIMGGPHVCLFPDTVLDVCDYAVRCEADDVLPDLVAALSAGRDPRSIGGLSFLDAGQVVVTPDPVPPAIPATIPDLSLIVGLQPQRGPAPGVMNTLQTSRGCRFHCRFCPTTQLFGGVYRNRDADSVIQDIRAKLPYGRTFLVVDNSFLSNRKRTMELLQRLGQEDLGAHLIVFERHEIGRDDEMLDLMWKAGVRCIIVGIESLEDENLRMYDKRQVSGDVVQSVHNILSHNIHVLGTFVLGGDGDTPETTARIARFVRDTGVSLNLFIMHDLEQADTPDLLVPLHRRFETYYRRGAPGNLRFFDYYTGNFVTYFPKRMKPSTLQQCMSDIYADAFSHWSNLRRAVSPNLFNAIFGVGHGYSMKRLGNTIRRVVDGYYMDYLLQIETGLYDEHEVLIEENVAGLESLPLPPPLAEQVDRQSYSGLMALGVLPGAMRYGMARWRRLHAHG